MNKLVMIRFGELGTKGKNKIEFIKILRGNIVESLSIIKDKKIEFAHDRVYIYCCEDNLHDIVDLIAIIPGIQNFSIVEKCSKNADELKETTLKIMENLSGTFKIKCSRADKTFPLNSDEVIRLVAGNILSNTTLTVNVHNPSHYLCIEIRQQGIFIFLDKRGGLGGYPLGSLGKSLVMLSGGIDSPVAAYQMIRRGIRVDLIHYASPPYTSDAAVDKIKDIVQVLTKYQLVINLYIIPFTKMQEAIRNLNDEPYMITLMRRMMYRIAERVAIKKRCLAIVSGESVGQVASQTLESINVISKAISIPHIRPLAVFDKLEIIKIATEINTVEISNRPFIDCCTIFTPINPTTKPKLKIVEYLESKFDYQSLIEEAITNMEVIQFKR